MKVTILGAGTYGLAVADLFEEKNCEVTIFTDVNEEYSTLVKNDDDRVTRNLEKAIREANLIVFTVPIAYFRGILLEVANYYQSNSHICIVTKGIDSEWVMFPYEFVKKILKTNNISIMGGPILPKERHLNKPIGLVIASKKRQSGQMIKNILKKENINIAETDDIIGVSILAAIKNVMAIGLGMVDGLSVGKMGKGIFFTKFFSDIIRIIYELGGDTFSILTYAGVGELYLAGIDNKNKNYVFGKMIGNNSSWKDINLYIEDNNIDGMQSIKAIYEILNRKRINIFIIDALFAIIYKNGSLELINDYLMEKNHDLKV